MAEAVIIGAGAVGVNAALFLSRLGFDVELLDSAPDILRGAPQASFINHGDGFEYFKVGHRRTGELCIDGSLVKALVYPLSALRTAVATPDDPIRFLLAAGAVGENGVTPEGFYENAAHMCSHFTRQFEALRTAGGWDEETAEKLFLRRPDSFWRRLAPPEFDDAAKVAAGCAGSSFGINMPHYYALVLAALRQSRVPFHTGVETEAVEKRGGGYVVHAGGRSFSTRLVLLTSGHHIPRLASTVRGVCCSPPAPGTFYLNSITFLRLPATADLAKLVAARRINFTLQQQHGSMYACVVPPTETEEGFAVTYYPSPRGSQIRSFGTDSLSYGTHPRVPAEWDSLIREGLPANHPNVRATFEQACALYPFLRDYAEVAGTICRPVFNAATGDNDGGLDRRVRVLPAVVDRVSEDGRVTAWTAPKWTNAELVALMATDYVRGQMAAGRLPKGGEVRIGPTGLDIVRIAPSINFFDVTMDAADALRYAEWQGVPARVVDTTLPQLGPRPPAPLNSAMKVGGAGS